MLNVRMKKFRSLDDNLLKWLINRTFESLKLDYHINNFNIRNGEFVGYDVSILDSTCLIQSLMCFRDNNKMVTMKCLNKKFKEYYKNLDIIPSSVDIKLYLKINL